MASWGVLLAWTGQRWDAPTATLHLAARNGRFPWCTAGAFGWYQLDAATCELHCLSGALPTQALCIGGRHIPAAELRPGRMQRVDRP
jgi:hypothetical protein